MITTRLITAFVLFFNLTVASADTVIEFKYDDKQSQFLTNGKNARINTKNTDNFILVDFSNNTIQTVDPDKKQVFNLSDSIPSISGFKPPKVRVDIKPAGKGPKIAGFKTRKFRLSADGDYCGTVYASKDAMKGTAIENMLDTLQSMTDSHLKSFGGFAAVIPACQIARLRLTDKLAHIGAPMRLIDIEGNVESEITRIIKNARVEPHYYAIPASFKNLSMDEKIEQAKQDIRQQDQAQPGDPQKHPTLQELQRSGRIPPEAMTRVKYYQEMMRQQR